MDDRLRKVEHELTEVKMDIKMQKEILSSINDTLKEMKEANKNMHEIDMKLVSLTKDEFQLENNIKMLFKRNDQVDDRLKKLEVTDSVQGVKLGSGEKLFWIGISAIAGLAIAFIKTNGGM